MSKPRACGVCARILLLIEVFARVPGINAVPHEDNLRYFDVSIHGPTQSPYEGKDLSLISLLVTVC